MMEANSIVVTKEIAFGSLILKNVKVIRRLVVTIEWITPLLMHYNRDTLPRQTLHKEGVFSNKGSVLKCLRMELSWKLKPDKFASEELSVAHS